MFETSQILNVWVADSAEVKKISVCHRHCGDRLDLDNNRQTATDIIVYNWSYGAIYIFQKKKVFVWPEAVHTPIRVKLSRNVAFHCIR